MPKTYNEDVQVQVAPPRSQFPGALTMLSVGVILAGLLGWIFYMWAANFPTIVGGTQVVQGLVLGALLARLAISTRLRGVMLTATIAGLCGAFSIALVWGGLYVQFVDQQAAAQEKVLLKLAQSYGPGLVQDDLTAWRAHPYTMTSERVVFPATGHRGFGGYLVLQQRRGIDLMGHGQLLGSAVWFVWLGEALAVILLPMFLATGRIREELI